MAVEWVSKQVFPAASCAVAGDALHAAGYRGDVAFAHLDDGSGFRLQAHRSIFRAALNTVVNATDRHEAWLKVVRLEAAPR